MDNGSNGIGMAKWKSMDNTTEGKNMVNGPFGMIMVIIKNKEHLILEKLMVCTNTGIQTGICNVKNVTKKAYLTENGPFGMKMTAT